jgi:glutamate synthase domain-containing protein 3
MAFLKKKLDDAATATAASEALRQLSKDHIPAHTREAAQTALEEWEGTQASPV